MSIPCEECLVYVMCKQKRYIECETLYKKLREGVKGKRLAKCLPNWVGVIWRPNIQDPMNYVFKVGNFGNYRLMESNDDGNRISMIFIDGVRSNFKTETNAYGL